MILSLVIPDIGDAELCWIMSRGQHEMVRQDSVRWYDKTAWDGTTRQHEMVQQDTMSAVLFELSKNNWGVNLTDTNYDVTINHDEPQKRLKTAIGAKKDWRLNSLQPHRRFERWSAEMPKRLKWRATLKILRQ